MEGNSFHNMNKIKTNFVNNNEYSVSTQKRNGVNENNGDSTP